MALITLFCSYPEGSKKKRRERSVTNNRAVRISKNPLVLLIVNTSTAYDRPSRKQRLPAINRLCISNPTRPTFAFANVRTRSLVTFVSWLHGSSLNLGVVVGYKLWVRTGRSVFVRFRASAVNNQLFHKSHFGTGKRTRRVRKAAANSYALTRIRITYLVSEGCTQFLAKPLILNGRTKHFLSDHNQSCNNRVVRRQELPSPPASCHLRHLLTQCGCQVDLVVPLIHQNLPDLFCHRKLSQRFALADPIQVVTNCLGFVF